MISAFLNAFRTPDLRRKMLFTLGIIVLFRLGSSIPTPNVNVSAIRECAASATDSSSLYAMVNLFSGGALLHLTIFALGIMPYITSSIILQLLTVVIPKLETLKKEEGSAGQEKITQYTRYLTIGLALLQATSFTMLAINGQLFHGCQNKIVYYDNYFVIVVMILTMTAGTSIIMWFGELITERGIGNGMSLLIFTQIVARFPSSMWNIRKANEGSEGLVVMLLVIGLGLLVMAGVVFVEQGQRRIPVQYAKRMIGNRLIGGTTTYIPIKVNQSGVIPVIFASSILYLPILFTMFKPEGKVSEWIRTNLATGSGPWYSIIFFILIILFCYFYVSITFNVEEISDNMKKYGGFIPGIRAGKPTEQYLAYVLSRLTAPGSLYLGLIALIPTFAIGLLGADHDFPFGGTSLLIMVGVGLDTVKQVESQLHQRSYEGLLK